MEQGCSYSKLNECERSFLPNWIFGSCFSQLWRNFASWPPLTNIFPSVCESFFVSRIAELKPVECQNSAHMFISSESVINFYGLKLMRLCMNVYILCLLVSNVRLITFLCFAYTNNEGTSFCFGYLSISKHSV